MQSETTTAITAVKQDVRLREWAEQLEAQQASGLTVPQWCAENGIKTKSFYYRLRRVREQYIQSAHAVVPLTVPQQQSADITAAVMCSRWNTNNKYMGFKLFSTKERADDAFNILSLMIKNGADVNGIDSHGNSGIWRFCLQSNQVLPSFNYVDHVLKERNV